MIILLFGPQGSGKSTQGKRLAAALKSVYASTGNIFREMVVKGDPLGVKLEQIMQRGELVPDSLTEDILKTWLRRKKPYQGVVLDGYPRNMRQAVKLNTTLKLNAGIDMVFELRVRRPVLVKRLQEQAKYEKRKDGSPEAVRKRLEIYTKETNPLLSYFRSANIPVIKIPGEQTKEQVHRAILAAVAPFEEKQKQK